MAAREVAGLLLSNLAADKDNAQQIADTHRAVSMLANCVVEGNVVVGTPVRDDRAREADGEEHVDHLPD